MRSGRKVVVALKTRSMVTGYEAVPGSDREDAGLAAAVGPRGSAVVFQGIWS